MMTMMMEHTLIALDLNIFQGTKSNLQTEIPGDKSKFPEEFHLAGLIPNVEELDIDKLKNCSFEIK